MISLRLGILSLIVSLSIITIALVEEVSPQAAHVMGLLLLGSTLISIAGLIYFSLNIKKQKTSIFKLAGLLHVITLVIICALIFRWF